MLLTNPPNVGVVVCVCVPYLSELVLFCYVHDNHTLSGVSMPSLVVALLATQPLMVKITGVALQVLL